MLRFWAQNFIPVALLVSQIWTRFCSLWSFLVQNWKQKFSSFFMHDRTHTSDVLLVLQKCFTSSILITTILSKKNKVIPQTGNFQKFSFSCTTATIACHVPSKCRCQVGPWTLFICPLRVIYDRMVAWLIYLEKFILFFFLYLVLSVSTNKGQCSFFGSRSMALFFWLAKEFCISFLQEIVLL